MPGEDRWWRWTPSDRPRIKIRLDQPSHFPQDPRVKIQLDPIVHRALYAVLLGLLLLLLARLLDTI